MKSKSIPEGYRSITPYLKLPNAGRLVEFLMQAFDGVERGRLLRPDGVLLHAELVIGDSLVMVHESPPGWDAKPSVLYLYVADVDATYQRAIEAGGVSLRPPTDMYYGDRVACVRDPSENDWWIATRMESPAIGEIQERAEAFLKARAAASS
jgi:PhnB protein